MPSEHYLFVTGRLAEHSLRRVVRELALSVGFDHSIAVLRITVAALMKPKWVARRLTVPANVTRVMVPGYCEGDLAPVEEVAGVPVERGPVDLRQLPEFFGQNCDLADYGSYDIEILAKIRHAPSVPVRKILARAQGFGAQGADVVGLECNPGETWSGVAEATRRLRDADFRVSIHSDNSAEIEQAIAAGAELVLSVDKRNRHQATQWGCEVVAVPDEPNTLAGLDRTVEILSTAGVPFRINPMLSPIGFGFAESLGRYLEVRRRWPKAAMLMALDNVTELTDVDSAGINVLLVGFCQELGIRSISTTEEANWARTAVTECNLARRLAHYAVTRHLLPRHLSPELVMLRDGKVLEHGPEGLEQLASVITDHSFRIFAEGGRLHVVGAKLHLESDDPFELFDQLAPRAVRPIDASHAFYLGYEMAKAVTALTLGKNYQQDDALDWGALTVAELTRRQRRALRMAESADDDCSEPREEPCD